MFYQEAGGSGSLLEGSAGFLRIIKYHTAIGMAIKMIEAHIEPIPIAVAAAGSVLPPTLISAPGTKLANVETAPKRHMKSPGQPHRTTEAMVAMRPVFLLFMVFSLKRKIYFNNHALSRNRTYI